MSYIEKDSYIHKLNPLTKLVITICVITLSFIVASFIHNLVIFAFILPLAYFSKLTKQVFAPIKYLFLIFVLLFGIQGLFFPFRQTPLVVLPYGITIWYEGIIYAAYISSRLLVMLVYGYLFVLTTHPGDLVSSLRRIKLPYKFGYIILATLQVIPRVQAQMSTIIEAQKSRGLETTGNVINKLKAYTPLLGPLFLGSVQQAVERTIALEARAFSAKCEKTSFRKRAIKRKDRYIMVLSVIITIVAGVVSWLL